MIPGIIENMPEAISKVHQAAGWIPEPTTKLHMGYRHVCQPWENCEGQDEQLEKEIEKKNKKKKTTEIKVEKKTGALILPPRSCPQWGATQSGCECIDSCDCEKPSGPSEIHRCETVPIKWENRSLETRCGQPESTGKWFDTCMVSTTPFPRPKFNIGDTIKKDPPEDKKEWRNFNSHKNKRFLPKLGCWSRDYYCASFPKFPGCDPGKTYSKLISKNDLSEEQQKMLDECKKLTDQKKCEAEESCGKGKEGTCHPKCVWSEDAPWWFRKLRGAMNHDIKRSGKDPAGNGLDREGNPELLPVLQPGPGGIGGEHGATIPDKDVVKGSGKKKSKKKKKKDNTKPAGDVGTKASEGFDKASEVGKNVGNDKGGIFR